MNKESGFEYYYYKYHEGASKVKQIMGCKERKQSIEYMKKRLIGWIVRNINR